jgi:integrase/recombinase XerD
MMIQLKPCFEAFLKDRQYLKNVSDRTLEWYHLAFKQFEQHAGAECDLTPATARAFVVGLRERGVIAITCNNRIMAVNAFLKWMYDEGRLSTRIRIPLQKVEQTVLQTMTDAQLRALVTCKPQTRASTLANLPIDTGVRIEEALGLPVSDVDLDNCLLKVRGKGRKERVVPFSLALRRVLFLWLKKRQDSIKSAWLFPTRAGTRLTRRNATRAHYLLLEKLKIPQSGFHRLRHTFATNYLRSGGDVVRLSRVLGHSQITTTMRYLHLQTEDLQRAHLQVSILERFARA